MWIAGLAIRACQGLVTVGPLLGRYRCPRFASRRMTCRILRLSIPSYRWPDVQLPSQQQPRGK